MTRAWWRRMRHRFIVVAGSLAMLLVASGTRLQTPSLSLDLHPSLHTDHRHESRKLKDRILHHFQELKNEHQDLKSGHSNSAS